MKEGFMMMRSLKEKTNHDDDGRRDVQTLAFETILMRIATEFINVDPEQYDQVLNDAFELVGLFFDVDRIYVFEYDFSSNTTSNTYEWCNEGISREIDNLKNIPLEDIFDDWMSYHIRGEAVNISDVSKLDHDSIVHQTLESQGILSVLTLPLIDQNQLLGFVGFDDNRRKRVWDEREFQLLKVLAEMITNSLIRQRIESDLIQAREEAMRANEARGKFLANISHGMRTPLSGIHNAIYLLQMTRTTLEQKQYLNVAQTSIETLSGILSDVLDLSKIDAGKMDVFEDAFDLEEELTKVISMQVFPASEKGVKLIFDFDYGIEHQVVGDVQKFRQIVLNLLTNATKYTNRGYVKVIVDHKDHDETIDLCVTIKDSGVGIPEEDIEHIFELFYRIHSKSSREQSGSGLGLPITYELIKLLGGDLSVTSKKDRGSSFRVDLAFKKGERHDYLNRTTYDAVVLNERTFNRSCRRLFESIGFTFHKKTKTDLGKVDVILVNAPIENESDLARIKKRYAGDDTLFVMSCQDQSSGLENVDVYLEYPVARHTVHQRLVRARKEKKVKTVSDVKAMKKGNVLIVDDNYMNRVALARILFKHGFSTEHVDSGIKAIEEVKAQAYDAVLMDIQMPGIDGYETTRRIRALKGKKKSVPIIAITANLFANDDEMIFLSGMDDVLHKPIQVDHVLMMLEKHMNRSHMIDIPENVPVFDKPDFERLYEGSENIRKQVILSFLDGVDRDLDAIEQAYIAKDHEGIRRALHYFKGSVGYVSGARVMWLIGRLLEQASDRDPSAFDLFSNVFKTEVGMLKKRLQVLVESE